MASLNQVTLIGNAGRDPETRTFPNGDKQVTLNIATTDKWKDKQSGEMKEHTEWHRLVIGGPLGGVVEKYVRKGTQVFVQGQIRSRKYNDKDGVEKIAYDIRVETLKMLDKLPTGGAAAPAARAPAPAPRPQSGGGGSVDDDIPFMRHEPRLIC